jgi:beta-lactam-binding protein with PASTA domain
VPKLAGLTVAAARTRLAAAHCTLGAVHKHRARGRSGIVLASRPTAGTTAPDRAKVAVTVRALRR